MLKPYDVVVDGNPTTLMLSDEDAAARGLASVAPAVKAAPKSANKARTTVANKGK